MALCQAWRCFRALAALMALGLALAGAPPAWGEELIRIGVLANRGAEHAMKLWAPHAEYLNTELTPLRFEVVPLAFAELRAAVQRRDIQFVITNSGHYTEMELAGEASRIATLLLRSPQGPLDHFGGVAFTRADNRNITRYADMGGLRLMAPDKSSLGGWQVHLREAREQGIDLDKTARSIALTGNHEKVVEGVLAGAADVGLIRTDVLESLAARDRVKLSGLRVINSRHEPGFPYLLSTRLYPEWPLAKVTGVPDELAKSVTICLLTLPASHPAAQAAGIVGWTLPLNYQSVHDLFRETRQGPYANQPITFADVLAEYGRPLAALLLLAFLSLVGLIWYINSVNASLKEEIRRRIETEHSLEESDSRFRDMADTLPSLMWMAGVDKQCTFFNRAWLAYTGRALDRELGDGWTQGVHPDDLAYCLNVYTAAFDARQPFEMKYRLRRADGEFRWIVDSGTPRYGPDGAFRGYFGHCLDITDVQSLATALEEGRERYALAQRAAHIASLDWNMETNRLQWSDEIEPMFGYAPGTFPHTFEAFMERVHPDDRENVDAAVQAAMEHDRHYAIEHRVVRPDGRVRWVAETGDVYRDAQNRAVRMIGIIQDITARRQAEEALRQSNDKLSASLAALQIHARDLTHLNEMNELLQSCLREEEIHRVFEHMARNLHLGLGGMLAIVRPGGRGAQTVASWGDSAGMESVFPLDACWGVRRGQIYESSHDMAGPHCAHFLSDPAVVSLCQPLVVQGETLGLITVRASAQARDGDWQRIRQLAVSLGEALKLALSNIRLREALREQATRDPLTGLFNRRYLDETLPRELHACLRNDEPLALAILDIDHFKRYNDTWGHEAGDRVLIEVSRILRDHLRASDIACRYGGEELVAVMPRAELSEARERLSRIANLVRDADVHTLDRPLPPVTFSAGIAVAPTQGEDADALLRAADQALYAAKLAGRDRVFSAGEDA